MIKLTISKKRNPKESLYTPYEGIFWVIGDTYILYMEQVDSTGSFSTTLEHVKVWEQLKWKYRAEYSEVAEYDYFPRGRISINPIYKNNKFSHYEVSVFIDNCINNEDTLDIIFHEFNLNQLNCIIKYIGSEGGITDNHYTCHNCRK